MTTVKIITSYSELKNHLNEIEGLILECFWEDDLSWFRYQIEYFKNGVIKKASVLVFDWSKLISFWIGIQNFWCEHMLDLWWIATSKEYRWKGLAKSVLEAFEKFWREESNSNSPHLLISNYKDFSSYYEKNWFEEIYSHHSKWVIMVKKL